MMVMVGSPVLLARMPKTRLFGRQSRRRRDVFWAILIVMASNRAADDWRERRTEFLRHVELRESDMHVFGHKSEPGRFSSSGSLVDCSEDPGSTRVLSWMGISFPERRPVGNITD